VTATPTQRLAELALGADLEQFVRDRRAAKRAWRLIARDLLEATDGQADITHESLRNWYPDAANAEPSKAGAA
jgi:hypothetical protein